MNKMQKIVCVIMVVAVLAAMCVTVFAGQKICPECNKKQMYSEETRRVRIGTTPCSIDPDMTDYVYRIYGVYTCANCGYTSSETVLGTETVCPH